MAEVAPLGGLAGRLIAQPTRVVAMSVAGPLDAAAFMRRAGAWRRSFAAAPGERHAFHGSDAFEAAAALFGAWHAGRIIYLPADTLPATVQALRAHVDGVAGEMPGGLSPPPDADAGNDRNHRNPGDWNELDPEAPRLVLYTSGSSGDPVAITKNLRQFASEVAALEARFGGLLGDALVHGTVSHQHIYGLLFRVFWPLASGRVFVTRRLEYPEQIAAFDPARPVALVASPALLKRLPEGVDWSMARASLRAVFSSGGPLPATAGRAVAALWGREPIEVFGSTETGGIASRQGAEAPWQPLPGVDCRIEEETLHVRSAHLADAAGWFRTEDRARSVDGGLQLLGRADRIVKLEERRISLDAIERALVADDAVEQARALVLPGARERIAAVVVASLQGVAALATDGRQAVLARLRQALRPRVEAIAIPKLWRFVESLPANAQGKTTQQALAELFTSGRPLPRWRERGPERAHLWFAAADGMEVFDGHFPGAPILPGVAMLDWAIAWGREAFAITAPFARMEALKFQRVVRPGLPVELELEWRAEDASLRFGYRSDEGAHASGRVVFAADAHHADATP